MSQKSTNSIAIEQDTATYRYRAIAQIVALKEPCNSASPEQLRLYKTERARLIKQAANNLSVSERTIIRWINSYKENKFYGLKPRYRKHRSDQKLCNKYDAMLREAQAYRVFNPTISIQEIIRSLEAKHPNMRGILKRSTLQHHLATSGFSRKQLLIVSETDGRPFFGRYRKEHILVQVQGDVKEPPRGSCVDEYGQPVTPYIQLWMDNHSRKILTYTISDRQNNDIALRSLHELLLNYGIPDTILTDQGAIYRSKAMAYCTDFLGIVHKRSKPYKPESKGALERLNGTLDALLNEVRNYQNLKYEEFKKLVVAWIDEYNNKKHSALKAFDDLGNECRLTPNEAYERGRAERIIKQLPASDIEMAFTMKERRCIQKDGVISFKGDFYVIPKEYAVAKQSVFVMYSTTKNLLSLVVEKCDSEDDNNTSVEFIPLFKREIKANVAFDSTDSAYKESMVGRYQPADTSASAKNNTTVGGVIERLHREICRNEGTYTSEEEFLRGMNERLFYSDKPKTEGTTTSAYANCTRLEGDK